MFGILAWWQAYDVLEAAREVALAAKAYGQRNVCQRVVVLDELLGVANADILQIGVGRHPDGLVKDAQQVVGAEGDVVGKVTEMDGLGKVGFKIGSGLLDGAAFLADGGLRG